MVMMDNPSSSKLPDPQTYSLVVMEPACTKKGRSGRSDRQHSEDEWIAMFPYISALYLAEELSLSEVMRIMEARYNFKATEAMYKKRMAMWQLTKYRRRSGRDSSSSGRDGRDKLAPMARRKARRKRIGLAPVISDVSTDRAATSILFNVKEWTLNSCTPQGWAIRRDDAFDTRTWDLNSCAPRNWPVVEFLRGPNPFRLMYMSFVVAVSLKNRDQGFLAGKAFRKAFLAIEDIIRSGVPGMEWVLMDLLYDMIQRGHIDIFVTLTKHVANMSRIIRPKDNSLANLAEGLSKYEGDVGTLLQRAYYCQIDALQEDAAARDYLSARHWAGRDMVTLEHSGENLEAGQQVLQVLRGARASVLEMELMKGPPAEGSADASLVPLKDFVRARTERAVSLMDNRPDPFIIGVAERVLFVPYAPSMTPIFLLKARASALIEARDWPAAELAMRKHLDALKAIPNMGPHKILGELWGLERILLELGKDAELDEVRREIDELVLDYVQDIPDDEP
ncbi:hypothetical protein F4778DRAFT_504544 [Xylariomycetidae sp. FL2044]|nr:hypothetical protein F4778DRAFT_504544 [Xylariomycetidae sp. FL2044]